VIDAVDNIFYKMLDVNHIIQVTTLISGNGIFVCYIKNEDNSAGYFAHDLVFSASSWHHIACVFDGSGTAKADRLKIYVDGIAQTLTFNAPAIPAITADLSGVDATIGHTSEAFDGKLDEFMIFSSALTAIQVADLYNRTRQGRF